MAAEKAFDLVIFDYDGTLSDTRRAIAHCLERALTQQRGVAPPAAQITAVVAEGLSLQETCLRLDRDLAGHSAALNEIVVTYRTLYRREGEALIEVFAGVGEALQELHAAGITSIVVSNKGIEAVRRSLDSCGLSDLVDCVFADEPGIPRKPDPALLTDHVQPKYPKIDRRRMMMVGDTEIDIQFANAAGITCCWAAYGFGDKERCRALEPAHVIERIADLSAIILRGDRR